MPLQDHGRPDPTPGEAATDYVARRGAAALRAILLAVVAVLVAIPVFAITSLGAIAISAVLRPEGTLASIVGIGWLALFLALMWWIIAWMVRRSAGLVPASYHEARVSPGRRGHVDAGEAPPPPPLDVRILEFERLVRAHDEEWWAAESELPAPRLELYELLRAARWPTRRREPQYARLTSLIVDLTRFIPDADLLAARPYLTDGGGIITGPDPTEEQERVYALFVQHRAERAQLLGDASIDASRRPIGRSRWVRKGEQWSEAGLPGSPGIGSPPGIPPADIP